MPNEIMTIAATRRLFKALRRKPSVERFKVHFDFNASRTANCLDWLPELVEQHLSFTGKCYRHCGKPTSLRIMLRDATRVLGAYVCQDGFVSQVVYFSPKPDLEWFSSTISAQVGTENFKANDVRLATRHGWELGSQALRVLETQLGPNPLISEIYWTRYPKTEAEKQVAISLCIGDTSRQGCLKLFSHKAKSVDKFCPACQSS